jgi:hypothetical protein
LRLSNLAPIAAALILAACQPPPLPILYQVVEPPKPVRAGRGIDMATDSTPVAYQLKQGQVDFVARYYRNPESRWPALSASEAQRLSSQGLNIVAVWESHSRYPGYFSYASGFRDATTANSQARAIGQPPGTAIYFAVDFDARNRSLDRVTEYFEGVAAGLVSAGRGIANYQIGVYGSGAVCDAIKRMGLARYAWLSNSIAWTGSLGYQDWNIRQSGRWPELSFNHDADEARDDYGGFRVVGYEVANANGGGASRDLVAVRMPQNGPPPTAAMIR